MAEFCDPNMDDANKLKERIKSMMVENLMLQVTATDIADDQPLFGPGSLGLDSVDALQLVVALDKNFGLKIPDPAAARVPDRTGGRRGEPGLASTCPENWGRTTPGS